MDSRILLALFLISCTNSDRFDYDSSKPEPRFDIFYDAFEYQNEPYIYANVYIGEDSEYYYYYWIIDGEYFYGRYVEKKVSYGKHFIEFVLLDLFGDTLSESGVLYVDEPLKITLLSPVEKYEAAKTDTIVFQYKMSGVDTWEKEPETIVYISADGKRWRPLRGNILVPPLNDSVYYWMIRADTAFSEIRSLCIKN